MPADEAGGSVPMRVGAVVWGLGVGGAAATPPRVAERWPYGRAGNLEADRRRLAEAGGCDSVRVWLKPTCPRLGEKYVLLSSDAKGG